MATRCPRCGNWIKEGNNECDQCGFSVDSGRQHGKSNVEGNPM
ncbi:MAG: hypothetical protein SV186_00980 [Candidatus Nanohaloarchaea archaeon]|nr:hypothetical protein [Candidatus Nanohaloarchaea archaeon]